MTKTDGYPELFVLIGSKVPDLRGLFLRGYGSQSHSQDNGTTVGVTVTLHESGSLGYIQGDASRNITGHTGSNIGVGTDGAFTGEGTSYWVQGARHYGMGRNYLDASRMVPTSYENRPVNMAVRYLIRAIP